MFSFCLNASELDEKIGQLFIAPICPTHGDEHIQNVHNLLCKKKIGGMIFMAGHAKVQRGIVQTLQNQLPIPLLTFQDAEWGVGMRLLDVASLPKNLTLGATQDLSLIKSYGLELARQCRNVGILGDFAPVCDVNSNPHNPVIGMRSLGDDPDQVAIKVGLIFEGMREGGLMASAKHFPGHGDTCLDSHYALPSIKEMQLAPFKKLIGNGIDMVMMGHLLYSEISELPSSLSSEIIQGVLRGVLKYDGVVITDSLVMEALRDYGSIGQICEKALFAGNDLLLFSTASPEVAKWLIEEGIEEAINHLKEVLTVEMIEEKIERINRLRYRQLPPIPKENPTLIRDIFRAAITEIGEVPLMGSQIALVRNSEDPTFEKALSRYAEVTVFSPSELEKAGKFDSLIIEQVKGDPSISLPSNAIVCLFDTPYALKHGHALIGYEDHPDAKEAVSDCLFGTLTPLGKLPVQLCERDGGEDGKKNSSGKRKI